MKNNPHKYYLSINEVLIDLNEIDGLKDMENFLNLALFTSIFKNEEELIAGLVGLGFQFPCSYDEYDVISIVKRVGNKRTGYSTKTITCDLLYKRDYQFLSIGKIKTFLYKNRNHVAAIQHLIECYRNSLDRLINGLSKKIDALEHSLSAAPVEERAEIRSELASRNNSLKNFCAQRSTLSLIANLMILKYHQKGNLPKNEEYEYQNRLDEFVDNETQYFRGGKSTPNNRGLVRLAIRIGELTRLYPELQEYSIANKNDKKRNEILKVVKGQLESGTEPIKSEPVKIYEEPLAEIDPDDYMFLEREDFERLRKQSMTKEEIDSIEDSIENLLERQGRLGK